MKTLIVSLAALAAVSGAALAQGGDTFQNSDAAYGTYSSHKVRNQAMDSNAFTVVKAGKTKPAAFERMNLQGEDRGSQDRQSSRNPS